MKRYFVFLVILFAGVTALNADVIYTVTLGAPSLGPNAVITATATLPTFITVTQSGFPFPDGSSSFSNAPEVASVFFFGSAGIVFFGLQSTALVSFPSLLYFDPQGDDHNLGYNGGNAMNFDCKDVAPCHASMNVVYRDDHFHFHEGSTSMIGTVEADLTISTTAVPEPGTFGLSAISLLALIVLACDSPTKNTRIFGKRGGGKRGQTSFPSKCVHADVQYSETVRPRAYYLAPHSGRRLVNG